MSKVTYGIFTKPDSQKRERRFEMRRLFLDLFIVSILTLGGASVISAQETAPKMIRGGVLNGKAVRLPVPAYPEAARADNAGGPVSVEVTIDEEGNVIEAKALSIFTVTADDGSLVETKRVHPALREAAEQAAREAKFSPTKLSGQPIKVKGTIAYNFVAGSGPLEGTSGVANNGRPVLNTKALTLPGPVYPEAALAARASGTIAVAVTVDESGFVIRAEALSGHPLLRAAAVDAARFATFTPVLKDGQPVQVQGVLTYDFSPPEGLNKTSAGGSIDGGVLNSKAISFPKPAYPPAARAVRAGGAVSVGVIIDTRGNVVKAEAVSGNPLLRAASAAAAREAKFEPALVDGKPVVVTGFLVYNFVP